MDLEYKQAERLVMLAAVIAAVSLVILFIDSGIKRQILREAAELREVVLGGRGDPGGQDGGREASGSFGIHGVGYGNHGGSNQPGLREDLAHANGGGIKKAPYISSPPGRAYLHGDRANNGSERILSSLPPESAQG